MKTDVKETNVAPSSSEGHYIKGAEVVNLDQVNETYHVKGAARLITKNHTTLELNEECLITCQNVYNPFSKMFEKSKD